MHSGGLARSKGEFAPNARRGRLQAHEGCLKHARTDGLASDFVDEELRRLPSSVHPVGMWRHSLA